MARRLTVSALLVGLIWGAGSPPQARDRVVAITIDDLPATPLAVTSDWASLTTRLLDALARHKAPTVGFVNETKLYSQGILDSSRVALLHAWLAAGHELGNHTFAHRSAHQTPLSDYLADIERGELVTRAMTTRAGAPLRYFRHPQLHAGRSLAYRHAVEQFLSTHRYAVAPVTVDNQEWMYARAYVVARQRRDALLERRIVKDYLRHLDRAFAYSEALSRTLFGRELPLVLLLHANELNADHLDTVLERLTARGYRFASLEAALADPAYQSVDTYIGPTGPSWLIRWALSRGLGPPAEPREDPYIRDLQTVEQP
jgi:peptidoglycan/xylan/chitin deacetylase (PgdA/CDA1 family)